MGQVCWVPNDIESPQMFPRVILGRLDLNFFGLLVRQLFLEQNRKTSNHLSVAIVVHCSHAVTN